MPSPAPTENSQGDVAVNDSKSVEPKASDWFRDVTTKSQLQWNYQNGREANRYTILETVGGGVGVTDFELDGQADLLCAGGGSISAETAVPSGLPCGLFRQQDQRFVMVAEKANLPTDIDYNHGVTVGDINNDGFPDVLITCYGSDRLLVNRGDGTFVDESISYGLSLRAWSTAAAFGDVNRDGSLDLFIASYVDWKPDLSEICETGEQQDVCPPQRYPPSPDSFMLNSGDGKFLDVSEEAGISQDGKGLGVISGDFDQDGTLDFYVANDAVANHLYLGWDGTKFRESGEIWGLAFNEAGSPEGSMGVGIGDIDGDLWPDVVVTNFELEDNSLYRNLRGQGFLHETLSYGLGGEGRQLVGFGTVLTDFDSDSWPDLCVLNGHVLYHNGLAPFRQKSLFYQNVQGEEFQRVTHVAPWFEQPHAARGLAVGDLNADGGPDIAISAINEPVSLLINNRPPSNWVSLQLVGTQSPRDAIGARVLAKTLGRDCVQFQNSGAGYLSSSERCVIFPVSPQEKFLDIRVIWPSGYEEAFSDLSTHRRHTIVEGHGQQAN